MPLFRSKKVVIEARHYSPDTNPESAADIIEWSGAEVGVDSISGSPTYVVIPTLEGPMTVNDGDYVIKGLVGEFYPCKPDVFHQKYEPIFEGECGGEDWEKQEEFEQPPTFEQDLDAVLNKHSQEIASNTPDYILANYLRSSLIAYQTAVIGRDRWWRREADLAAGVDPVELAEEDSEKRQHHNYDSSNPRPHELSDKCWCNPTIMKVEGKK